MAEASQAPPRAVIETHDPRVRLIAPAIALAGAYIALAPDLPQPFKAISILFVLTAPGAGFMTLVLGRRERMDLVTWLCLSVISSMAGIPLLVGLLNAISARIEAHDMAHIVGGVSVGFAILIALTPASGPSPAPIDQVNRRAGLAWFAGLLVVLAMVGLGAAFLPERAPAPYFRFQLAGRWRYLSDVVAPSSRTLKVQLLLESHYPRSKRYTLVPDLAGAKAWDRVTFTVPKDGFWKGTISGPAPTSASCYNRMALHLRAAGSSRDLGLLTFYVKGRHACPGLNTTTL